MEECENGRIMGLVKIDIDAFKHSSIDAFRH
jgi:hypothetical protein